MRASLVGRGQATATAIGAAAVVRSLAEGEVRQAGIWLAEEVVRPGPFFERLAYATQSYSNILLGLTLLLYGLAIALGSVYPR